MGTVRGDWGIVLHIYNMLVAIQRPAGGLPTKLEIYIQSDTYKTQRVCKLISCIQGLNHLA